MATATLEVLFMGLAGIVLQDPAASTVKNDIKVALVDGSQVAETKHHPVLVLDLALVRSAGGIPNGINFQELPNNLPYTIADPIGQGRSLLVLPLEGLEVSFEKLMRESKMPLNLSGLPDLHKAANGNGMVVARDLDLRRNRLLMGLVALAPGISFEQTYPRTPKRWCFSSNQQYFDQFYLAARYVAEFDASTEIEIKLEKHLLNGDDQYGSLTLRSATRGEVFRLAISNEPTFDEKMPASDNLHAQALCALVGLAPTDNKKCPWPMPESGGLCASAGGNGTGVGCSPFIVKGN